MARQKKELPAPVMQEIATIHRDPFQYTYGGIIRPRDETLATRGGARGIWIYEDLKRDGRVRYGLGKRRVSLIARPVKVDPASEDAIDKQAADWWRKRLVQFRWNALYERMLDANLKGYAVVELVHEIDLAEAKWIPRFKARDQRRFVFDEDGNLRMLTREQMLNGVELPPRKFIVHTVGASDENPYGVGEGASLFWYVLFKRQGLTFWLTFIDKLGIPTAIGKYPAGTKPEEVNLLRSALEQIRSNTGIVMSEGMLVEFLELKASGNITTQEQLVRYMDEQIDAVLGLEQSGRSGGGALAAAAMDRREIRLDVLKALDESISETLNDTVVRWYTEWNFPGARPPRIYRDCEEAEDLDKIAATDEKLFKMGYRRKLESVTAKYGEGYEDIRAAQLEQERAAREAQAAIARAQGRAGNAARNGVAPDANDKRAEQPNTNVEFAAGDIGEGEFPDQVAIDVAIDAVTSGNLQALALPIVKPFIDYVTSAKDQTAVLTKLAEAMPEVDTSVLEKVLARVLFGSMIWGRLSADEERKQGG